MVFLIENESAAGVMKYEAEVLKDVIKASRFHRCVHLDMLSLRQVLSADTFRDIHDTIIPFGSIEFVELWYRKYYNIPHINPMEIPRCLRLDYFLKRRYDIVKFEDLPSDGTWFIKDVSRLKSFFCVGNKTNIDPAVVNTTHWFQCSEYIPDIMAEYRLYFIEGSLENVCNYNGIPIHPIDYDLIMRADGMLKLQADYPGSYTMDVMVSGRGTALIELHPFICVGLYSTLWGDNLINAYIDGHRYIRDFNTACYLQE